MLIVKPILIETRKKQTTAEAEAFLLFFMICILSGIVDWF